VLDPSSVKQVVKLAAELGQLTFGHAFDRSGPRHGSSAGLEDQFNATVWRESRRRSTQDVCKLILQGREGWVVSARQREGGIDQPQRSEV
jgi:hypothetical protein